METQSNYSSADSSDLNLTDSSSFNDVIYNIDLKIKAISWAKNYSVHSASCKYKISRIFIRKWLQNESIIQQQIKSDPMKDIDQILMDLMTEEDNNKSHNKRSRSSVKSGRNTDENNNNKNSNNTRHQIHEENHAEFICNLDDCGKKFISKGGFQNHRLLHMPSAQRPEFKCTVSNCMKVFKQPSGLSRHKKVHFKKEFACAGADCTESFRSQAKLNSHIRREHDPDKRHCCPEPGCEKSFKHSSGLSRHRRSRHHHEHQHDPKSNLKNAVNNETHRYQCHHCSKSYKSKSYLKFHATQKH